MSDDPGPVIGPAIQNIVARRLGRAGIGLVVISALGLVEMALGATEPIANLATVLVPLACGGALLALGMRTVKRAFGAEAVRWSPLISVLGLLPLGFGIWLLAYRGLRAFAIGGAPHPGWVGYAAWAILGYRLLRDSARLSEAGLLAQTMIVPAPEETSDVS